MRAVVKKVAKPAGVLAFLILIFFGIAEIWILTNYNVQKSIKQANAADPETTVKVWDFTADTEQWDTLSPHQLTAENGYLLFTPGVSTTAPYLRNIFVNTPLPAQDKFLSLSMSVSGDAAKTFTAYAYYMLEGKTNFEKQFIFQGPIDDQFHEYKAKFPEAEILSIARLRINFVGMVAPQQAKIDWVKLTVPAPTPAPTTAILPLPGTTSPTTSPPTPGAQRPNIVLILTDDMDFNQIPYMPNVNKYLVDQGTFFNNYIDNNPICCPSRATILTGLNTRHTGVFTNILPYGGFEKFKDTSTIATWLSSPSMGYNTVLLGKYLNGYPNGQPTNYVPPGWTSWYGGIGDDIYRQITYNLNENGTVVYHGYKAEDYLTDVITGKMLSFITDSVSQQKPFFVYYSTPSPHQPAVAASRHQSLFLDTPLPMPPSFNEADVSDKPKHIRDLPLLNDLSISTDSSLYRRRLQSLMAVDEMIPNLINTLEASGQLNNTYIFFTSDNGFHLGNHRIILGKQTAYETDIHLPLIVRGPGIPAGRKIDHLVSNIDLAPTFAEIAGVQVPYSTDGKSLVPLLGSTPPDLDAWRKGILVEHWLGGDIQKYLSSSPAPTPSLAPGITEMSDTKSLSILNVAGTTTASASLTPQTLEPVTPSYYALRTRFYTYVEYVTGEKELYANRVDPHQLDNMYNRANPQLLVGLRAILESIKTGKTK